MQDLIMSILNQCEAVAKDFVKEEAEAFLMDSEALRESITDDLGKWTEAYKAGEIDKAGLKRLIKRKQTLLQVQALTQIGIAEIRLEKLQNKMCDIVVNLISTAV